MSGGAKSHRVIERLGVDPVHIGGQLQPVASKILAKLLDAVLEPGEPSTTWGEWNPEPSVLDEAGWPEASGAGVLAPGARTRNASALEFLAVSKVLAPFVEQVAASWAPPR